MAQKFEFRELSSDDVAKTLKTAELADNKLCEAIITHLKSSLDSDGSLEDELKHEVHFSKAIYSEEDIKNIKYAEYKNGYDSASVELKTYYETQISDIENKQNKLISTLVAKFNELTMKEQPINDYLDLIAEVIENIAEKLFLDVPANFKKILNTQIGEIFKKGHKNGQITIHVNEKQKPFIEHILASEEIAAKMNDIVVGADSRIKEGDCVTQYNHTKLVYDKALVKKEIDEIIKQFKQD